MADTQALSAEGATSGAPSQTSSQRLTSLDAFRGATMALMVLVNTAGNGNYVYAPLKHSEWNGWTLTDVVFPSFLWIVGVAITLSAGKRTVAGASRATLFSHALRRAVVLYAFGLVIYGFPLYHLATLRLMGVLQRIAICYLIATAIFLTTRVRGQVVWIMSLLTGYWLVMTLAPVPGYGAGHLDMEHNFAHYVDQLVLGTHNYVRTKTWDPEGLVSTLPAIATTLFGILAGHILRIKRTVAERTVWLFLAGNVLLAAGEICNIWLPINKKLWTTSFSVFMAGLDFVVFAIFLWVIDHLKYKRFVKPLLVMGMNAIAVYMASELLDEIFEAIHWGSGASDTTLRLWLYQTLFAPLAAPINASLLYAIAYTLLMYALAYGLYRRDWFLRV